MPSTDTTTTELGGINQVYPSQEASSKVLKGYRNGARWERPRSRTRMIPAKLQTWWSDQRDHDIDHYDLPTSSSISFEDSRRISKSGLSSSALPSPAEGGPHRTESVRLSLLVDHGR